MTDQKQPRSIASTVFAYIAIAAGTTAFLQAGMKGSRVGWEEMMIYTVPAVLGAIIAIAIRRNKLSYIALFFGALGVVSFFLGA